MIPIMVPIEIRNIGGIKLTYNVDCSEINKYNQRNDDFQIFKLDNTEGQLAPGDVKYIIGSFRPLTNKLYQITVPIQYSDELSEVNTRTITLSGKGYHPLSTQPPLYNSIYKNMPKNRIHNYYDGKEIQLCGLSLEEIDFGYMEDRPSSKTFIIYNNSPINSFYVDFINPGFNMKDEIDFEPKKEKIEPNSYLLVKCKLTPKGGMSSYEGDVELKINWTNQDGHKVPEKESLFIRIIKQSLLKELPGKIENTANPNISFIETILFDYMKEIICDTENDNLLCDRLDNQPLDLYSWTNNIPYVTHEEVRGKLLANYTNKVINNTDQNSSNLSVKRTNQTNSNSNTMNPNMSQPSIATNKLSFNPNIHNSLMLGLKRREEKETTVDVDEAAENNIDDKYIQELISKMQYTTPEINEKLLLVNENTKNLIGSVLENTVYNIIAEAVYGEADLSEKTRIYFFNKK